MFELFEEAYTYVFLGFNLFYGLSELISSWQTFENKLVNTLFLLGDFVFICILWGYEGFLEGLGVALSGMLALWIGSELADSFDVDFRGVFLIVTILAFIAAFIVLGVNI